MMLSAVIYFIQGIIYAYTVEIKVNSWIWDILITSLLYYWLFKIRLYKHHYVSMILIVSFRKMVYEFIKIYDSLKCLFILLFIFFLNN